MRVVLDNLWLCVDCTQAACNGSDGMDISPETLQSVKTGLARLPHLAADFDSETGDGLREFSSVRCDGCHTTLAGYRARFAQLGN